MLTLDEPSGFPLFALASILVSLAAVPVAMTRAEAPVPPGSGRWAGSPTGWTGARSSSWPP